MIIQHPNPGRRARHRGFTLAEVTISVAIASLSLGGIIYGYVLSAKRAEWSAYSLAAQSLAMMRVEQVLSSKWDPASSAANADMMVNATFPAQVNILDIPVSGTNYTYATNFTTITTLSTSPPLKMIQVDCVWKFSARNSTVTNLFTNTVVTYRAPEN
ncbi:MAG TPA: prepilin-type N-terminal cleavage/methylation domain-containing protein [Verrucomicrobiae bacterium]|nr:prepilin-type N-terminal cleavage/methylation domain-containing protein [Verrucomicrobiae bacterium]